MGTYKTPIIAVLLSCTYNLLRGLRGLISTDIIGVIRTLNPPSGMRHILAEAQRRSNQEKLSKLGNERSRISQPQQQGLARVALGIDYAVPYWV